MPILGNEPLNKDDIEEPIKLSFNQLAPTVNRSVYKNRVHKSISNGIGSKLNLLKGSVKALLDKHSSNNELS